MTTPIRTLRWIGMALLVAAAALASEPPAMISLALHRHADYVKVDPLIELLAAEAPAASPLAQRLAVLADEDHVVTMAALRGLEKQAQGVLRFEERAADVVTALVDRTRLRQDLADTASPIGRWLAARFPEQAAAAHARFGITVFSLRQPGVALAEAALTPHMVVLVHGLDDPGGLWNVLIRELVNRNYQVGELRYPNDQAIDRSSAVLGVTLAELRRRGVTRVSLIAHSMGGLICRNVLTSNAYYAGDGAGTPHLPEIDRLITIGTPHHGSEMARLRALSEASEQMSRLMRGDFDALGGFFEGDGTAERDLLPGSAFLRELNARPLPRHTRITIIAGRMMPQRTDSIFDPLLTLFAGDPVAARHQLTKLLDTVGDGVVTLASSRLDGVEDYHLVEADHLTLIVYGKANQQALPPALPIVLEKLAAQ